jgi:hypothetical protein
MNVVCDYRVQGVLPVQGNTTGAPLAPAAGAIVLSGRGLSLPESHSTLAI